jgi:ribosome maturation factor RimP
LANAKENLKTFKQFKIFELNKVFLKEKNKIKEIRKITGLIINAEENPQVIFQKCAAK